MEKGVKYIIPFAKIDALTAERDSLRADLDRAREALTEIRHWIARLPIPTTGATLHLSIARAALGEIDAPLAALHEPTGEKA